MTTQNHPEIRPEIGRDFARRARPAPAPGPVDFTVMYAAHDAFYRDLIRLTEAARSGRTGDPAVRAGWTTFKNQLHLHHTAEDIALWPALRQKVTDPAQIAVLDAMEAEHARIDPMLAQVDAALAGASDSRAALSGSVAALADTLTGHMGHEEDEALPPPVRLLYRAVWRPAYARRPRWTDAAS